MNLASIIDGHDSNMRALIEGDVAVTYGELRKRVDAARQHLADRGIKAGDHVALVCTNEVHFVTAALAILGIGAAVAPINPYAPINELSRKMVPLTPRAIVVGAVAREVLDHPDAFEAELIDMESLPTEVDHAVPVVSCEPDTTACLLSTSGVSGAPKIAILSHGNLAWVHDATIGEGPQQLRSDDVVLGVLPPAHILGLNLVLLATLQAGATVVLQARFDTDESLALVQRHNITMLIGAPPMWQRWANGDAPSDAMRSVRFARSGAAALPSDVFEGIRRRFGVEVVQGYGLTETSSVVAEGRGIPVRPTSVGRLLPGVELVLVDDDGEPVDSGDIGEIVLRSPAVFKGYLGDPEATAQVLTSDGWLWTGDVGVFDDDGYLYLVDRVKDIVIVSGFNVYPAEIEDVLMQHPNVRGAVVVGSPHPVTGETVVAYVSGTVEVAELEQLAAANLSRYKRPTEYYLVDELPETSVGKVVRRELRS